MKIKVSATFVDAIYDIIQGITHGDINQIETKDLAINAMITVSASSLIENMTSIRGIANSFSNEVDSDHDLREQLSLEHPFLLKILNYYKNLPNHITQKDLQYTAQNITKDAIQFSPSFMPSKDNIHNFLITLLEFYLLDKKIDFSYLIKDPETIKQVENASWLFERSNEKIKNLLFSKVENNEFFLDVDFLYLLAISFPHYINDALITLNLRSLERGSNMQSEGFERDLKKIRSIQASKNAKKKADQEALKRAPTYQKIEQLWDEGEWSLRGRGKYSKFANIHHGIEGLEFDAIRNYISKYDKAKV